MPKVLHLVSVRALSLDLALARTANAAVHSERWLALLRALSRFGDWGLSLTAGVVLLLGDSPAAMGRFAAAVAAGLLLQKSLKVSLARPRPCIVDGGPLQRAPIPDAGSFPSGHTLHATLAAAAVAVAVPPFALLFAPLAVCMGWARVALGVHYPSDVLAGASLGAALGALAFLG